MKNKKTGKIIALMILISLAMPMVLASDIQNFLTDMKAHPGNYYILHTISNNWYNRNDLGMLDAVNNFASKFPGVTVSNIKIPGKKPLIISLISDNLTANYSGGREVSFIKTDITAGYLVFFVISDNDYEEWITTLDDTELQAILNEVDINHDTVISEDEIIADNLKTGLNYLAAYNTNPITIENILVVHRGVVEEGYLTCAEFKPYDYSVWFQDQYTYKGINYEDTCLNDALLGEIGCEPTSGYVNWGFWTCPRGCSHGRCIWSGIYLAVEYKAGDIDYTNFYDSLHVWLNA